MPKQIHKKAERHRMFCFTSYQQDRPNKESWMQYLAGQHEICPTTERKHWQLFCYMKEAMTLQAFIKAIPGKPHVEVCRGSFQANYDYCSKSSGIPGTFKEEGQRPRQGERSDIAKACQEVKSGGLTAVSDDTILVKYHRGLSALMSIRASTQPHIFKRPDVIWIHGPTGCGKTKAAYDFDPFLYKQTSTDGWFDGYYDQKTICIDDFDQGTFPLRELLQMLDGYKYQAKVKGGFTTLKATTIFITSHFEPEAYFPKDRWPEIKRRIKEIRDMGESVLPPPTSVELLGDEKI